MTLGVQNMGGEGVLVDRPIRSGHWSFCARVRNREATLFTEAPMIYRVAIPVFLAVSLAVSAAQAQTDTGPYPPPKSLPRNAKPSATPWTVPGTVCSAATPQ